MDAKKVAMGGCMLFFASNLVFGQVVEKSSASFSFPNTLTSVSAGKSAAVQASFFRTAGSFSHKGIVMLEWSVPATSEHGRLTVYSVSGALVKNLVLTKNQGSLQCDLSRSAAGIYLVTLSYGSYRQNLKLALYK